MVKQDRKNICIIDNSLITCTLIYRLLEERLPNATICYYLDPADLLLKQLTECNLMIIDEALIHHRGTEILGHLYDYIQQNPGYTLEKNFPKVLFSTNYTNTKIIERLGKEKILNKIDNDIIQKPFLPDELEDRVEIILGIEPELPVTSLPHVVPSSFLAFFAGLKSVFSM